MDREPLRRLLGATSGDANGPQKSIRIYGTITTSEEEEALDDLVCTILDSLAGRWHRLTGVTGRYLTVTVGGHDASQVIHALQAHLAATAPRHWQLLDTPIVEGSR